MCSAPVVAETFQSFADLATAYKKYVDYRITRTAGLYPTIVVVAPHGRAIERPTSQIATANAGNEFSCYRFEGIRTADNYDALHLTSDRFDEPTCLTFISECAYVVSVHGCAGAEMEVLVGGLDKKLKALIGKALADHGVRCRLTGHKFPGTSVTNICNLGRSRAGVQLELTSALWKSQDTVARVVQAVRSVLSKLADAGAAGEGHLNPQ